MPNNSSSDEIETNWNIGEAYTSRINGRFNDLKKSPEKNKYYLLKKDNFDSFDSWLQNVVWYGNKRGDYLNNFKVF